MGRCPKCERSQAGASFCPVDGARLLGDAPSESDDPMLGQTLSERYRIVRRLGVGGMGTVYEAEHLFIEKRVAIKLLRPEITESEDAMLRLQREAMAASTIGHQNIVTIDDFGHLPDGRAYLSMECLEGQSLADIIRQGGLTTAETLRIAKELCDGLSAAHGKGIVHRDVKADNVFLVDGGGVKILDFGIAKAQGNPSLTQTGAIYGTPNYMAPEQALGRDIDHRVDVYAVGVLLFEMLTGRVPFIADTFMAILTQHVTEDPPAPSTVAQGREVGKGLDALVLRAMAKDPSDRFQTAAQLSAELQALPRDQADGSTTDQQPGAAPLASVTQTAGEMHPIASPPQYRKALFLGLISVCVVASLVYAYTIRGESDPASTMKPDFAAPRTVATLPGNTPADAVRETQRDSGGVVPPSEVDAGGFQLIVGSDPNGATIYGEDKQVLGITPALLKLPGSGTMDVRIERKMFWPKTVSLRSNEGGKIVVKLKRRLKAPYKKRPKGRIGSKRSDTSDEDRRKRGSKTEGMTHGTASPAKPTDDPLDPY
jgi:serine/threonine protein kinase